MKQKWKAAFKCRSRNEGFTLVMAMGMGLMMLIVATTLIFRASRNEAIASSRTQSGDSLAVAEAGVARTLAQMTKPENTVLLSLNYDPINPNTNKNYLGADGVPNTSDDSATAVDDWTSVSANSSPCTPGTGSGTASISCSGAIGTDGQYTLKAYRYKSTNKTGTFLLEGKRGSSTSNITVTVSIDSSSATSDFPGVLAVNQLSLMGRSILGRNGNVYYDPISVGFGPSGGSAAPGDSNRGDYLNAIRSGSADGITFDSVSGKIFASKLEPTLSYNPPSGVTPTSLGDTTGNTSIPSLSSSMTHYETGKIDIQGNTIVNIDTTPGSGPINLYVNGPITVKGSATINVNTTNGPVNIYVNGAILVDENAKIRNVRNGGVPGKVGDLRIIISTTDQTQIYGNACIQNAFFYSRRGNLQLGGSGDGCDSPGITNIDGVVWVQSISNTNTNSNWSGIAVPDDLSSLSDVATSIGGVPTSTTYKLGVVKNWQKHQL
jgi:predicted transport protein